MAQRRLEYSSLRCATQELVWQSVLRAIESDPDSVNDISTATPATHGGSLALDENVILPAYIDTMDVHLMPGNYQGGRPDNYPASGAHPSYRCKRAE